MSKIIFHKNKLHFRFEDQNKIKKFLEMIIRDFGKHIKDINYVLVTDSHLLALNKQFLNHDFYTDILTFELSEDEKKLEGEI